MRKQKGEKRPFPKMPRAVPPFAPVEASNSYKLLSKQEVLALLGVSPVTLWDWIRKGYFPEAVIMGPDGGKQGWIEKEVHNAIHNGPRRKLKASKAA